MRAAIAALAILALVVIGAGLAAYSGLYNIAADAPHWPLTEQALEILRERSIGKRSRDVTVPPDLQDEKRVLIGAGQYAEMCESCHLAPGVKDTPLRQGLYPRPPDLTRERLDPREAFWIVKHGIKMTGMPAWGASHDDDTLWSVVTFLQKLPQLDAKRYRELVAKAPPDEEIESTAPMHGGRRPPLGQPTGERRR